MQAVIMAGGRGTRLAELTRDEIPKPMVELAGKPLLLWQIERLKENGIQDILLVIGHLGSVIRDYFGDGSRFGVKIRYFEEKEPKIFKPVQLTYKVKKPQPATPKQIAFLENLIRKRHAQIDWNPDTISRSEASRLIDELLKG